MPGIFPRLADVLQLYFFIRNDIENKFNMLYVCFFYLVLENKFSLIFF